MKRLFLIRHAKSISKDTPGIKDFDRPLDARGNDETRYIGDTLKNHGIIMDAYVSSPAKRALDTARLIAERTGFPRNKIEVVGSVYESNIPKLLKAIKNFDDGAASVALFGHNPEFLNLVNYLAKGRIAEFPTCGVFGIDFEVDSWADIGKKKGKIVFFEGPK